jgi:hypothetical protein
MSCVSVRIPGEQGRATGGALHRAGDVRAVGRGYHWGRCQLCLVTGGMRSIMQGCALGGCLKCRVSIQVSSSKGRPGVNLNGTVLAGQLGLWWAWWHVSGGGHCLHPINRSRNLMRGMHFNGCWR